MSASNSKLWWLIILIIGCVGCERVGSEEDEDVEKTYPPALDLPVLDLSTALTSSDVPDSFNVNVNVVDIHICPENMVCYLPDGITIAERDESNSELDSLRLYASQPSQFEVDQSYLMSLKVLNRIENDSTGAKTVGGLGLVGYSLIEVLFSDSR